MKTGIDRSILMLIQNIYLNIKNLAQPKYRKTHSEAIYEISQQKIINTNNSIIEASISILYIIKRIQKLENNQKIFFKILVWGVVLFCYSITTPPLLSCTSGYIILTKEEAEEQQRKKLFITAANAA